MSYFKRNWANNKFFKFSEISDDEIIKRTNNICESYHRYLNNNISHYHPKIGYLIIKLKEYVFNAYKKYRENLLRKININIEKADISSEIFKFITKYKNLFSENFDLKKFIDNLNSYKDDLCNIFKLFLDTIYDERDDFFDIIYGNQSNSDNDINDENVDNNILYSEEDLRLKFDGLNLYNEQYKNQELYENFDEQINLDNKKNKKNIKKASKDTDKIVKNKIKELFGY